MKLLFKVNPFKRELRIFYSDVRSFLEENNVSIVEEPEEADILLTIGGDGTILYNRVKYSKYDLPIFGIGTETSFICQAKTIDWKEKLEKLINKKYSIESRTLLDIFVNNEFIADSLNEALIRNIDPKILRFDVLVKHSASNSNRFIFSADGFIVATPTGSSAHAYACYADIIDESTNSLVLVAVAPHRREFTPMYILNTSTIEINLSDAENRHQRIQLVSDGLCGFNLSSTDIILIKRSKKKQKFIKI
ncbi:MAG: hypothetical protein QXF76_01200 [Candidatus Anstonellales archaeon]